MRKVWVTKGPTNLYPDRTNWYVWEWDTRWEGIGWSYSCDSHKEAIKLAVSMARDRKLTFERPIC